MPDNDSKIQIWYYLIYIILHLLIITYMTSHSRDFFVVSRINQINYFLCYYVTLFCR